MRALTITHEWGTQLFFAAHLGTLDGWGIQELRIDRTQAEPGRGTRVVRLPAAEIAGAELTVDFAQRKADAIAVRERRRGMELKLGQSEGAEKLMESRGLAVEL